MHKYMILVEVPSTAPLFGLVGNDTSSKVRVVGTVKASNSVQACSKTSEKLGVPYDKLKALLYEEHDGGMYFEHYQTIE